MPITMFIVVTAAVLMWLSIMIIDVEEISVAALRARHQLAETRRHSVLGGGGVGGVRVVNKVGHGMPLWGEGDRNWWR